MKTIVALASAAALVSGAAFAETRDLTIKSVSVVKNPINTFVVASTDTFSYTVTARVMLGTNACEARNSKATLDNFFYGEDQTAILTARSTRKAGVVCPRNYAPVFGDVSTVVSGKWENLDQIKVKNVNGQTVDLLDFSAPILNASTTFFHPAGNHIMMMPAQMHVRIDGDMMVGGNACQAAGKFVDMGMRKRGDVISFEPVRVGYNSDVCVEVWSPVFKKVSAQFVGLFTEFNTLELRNAGVTGTTVDPRELPSK